MKFEKKDFNKVSRNIALDELRKAFDSMEDPSAGLIASFMAKTGIFLGMMLRELFEENDTIKITEDEFTTRSAKMSAKFLSECDDDDDDVHMSVLHTLEALGLTILNADICKAIVKHYKEEE